MPQFDLSVETVSTASMNQKCMFMLKQHRKPIRVWFEWN